MSVAVERPDVRPGQVWWYAAPDLRGHDRRRLVIDRPWTYADALESGDDHVRGVWWAITCDDVGDPLPSRDVEYDRATYDEGQLDGRFLTRVCALASCSGGMVHRRGDARFCSRACSAAASRTRRGGPNTRTPPSKAYRSAHARRERRPRQGVTCYLPTLKDARALLDGAKAGRYFTGDHPAIAALEQAIARREARDT